MSEMLESTIAKKTAPYKDSSVHVPHDSVHLVVVFEIVDSILVSIHSTVPTIHLLVSVHLRKLQLPDLLHLHFLHVFLQILDTPRRDAILLPLPKRLSHLPQEVLRLRHRHIRAEIRLRVQHGLIDPFGELAPLLLEAPVAQNHNPVIILPSQHTPQALRRMPHGVEREEIILPDPIVLAQEFEARFEDAGLRVLEGHTDAEHRAAVMVVEIDPLGDFAPRDAEEDRAPAVAACGAVGFQGQGGFLRVRGFHED